MRQRARGRKQRARRSWGILEERILPVRKLEDWGLRVEVAKREDWLNRVRGILIKVADLLVEGFCVA